MRAPAGQVRTPIRNVCDNYCMCLNHGYKYVIESSRQVHHSTSCSARVKEHEERAELSLASETVSNKVTCRSATKRQHVPSEENAKGHIRTGKCAVVT